MEKKYKWSKKYDPSSKEPYVLSRSKIDLFLNCKRCLMMNQCNACKDCMFSFNIKACVGCGHPEPENNINRWLNNKASLRCLDERVKSSIKEELEDKLGSIEEDNNLLKNKLIEMLKSSE